MKKRRSSQLRPGNVKYAERNRIREAAGVSLPFALAALPFAPMALPFTSMVSPFVPAAGLSFGDFRRGQDSQ